ncbi:predicted protein [Histoplasma capsulatum var. duboisii H88]|uniref:Predicted protein n=1 Tax=Ajellomyces capsulatus (strain H88) TaxID=544711 RepID=F0UFD5_AJEC8|nr:predicted protein [Histoplasma capsulatum var. duboisii H88]
MMVRYHCHYRGVAFFKGKDGIRQQTVDGRIMPNCAVQSTSSVCSSKLHNVDDQQLAALAQITLNGRQLKLALPGTKTAACDLASWWGFPINQSPAAISGTKVVLCPAFRTF